MGATIPDDRKAEYRRAALEREAERKRADAERRDAGWAAARRAAEVLKTSYGATRVVVYGSLAHGYWFGRHSDIDMAVEGILPVHFWRAWAAVDRAAPGFEVNLLDIETATESLKAVIEREGVEL
jgi:predicted nucleotidyltransferase